MDNERTKFSMLKARSDNDVVDKIVQRFASFEPETKLCTWLARVASKSNIADPPSRGASAKINEIVHDFCANP